MRIQWRIQGRGQTKMRPKGPKKNFSGGRGPPLISGSGWPPPPLSQGLDPPMGFSVSLSVWFHVVLFPFCPSENISTTSTSDDQRSKWIRFIQVLSIFTYECLFKPLIGLHNLRNAHFRLKSLWVGLIREIDRALSPVMAKVRIRFSDVVCPLSRLHNYESHDCTIVNRFWICGVTSFML